MPLQSQVVRTIDVFFERHNEWYRCQNKDKLKESMLGIAEKGGAPELLMILLDLYDQRKEPDWREYLAFSALAVLDNLETIPASFRGTIPERILAAPVGVQRWWIACCRPIAARHPEVCTPELLIFLVELIDTIQDQEEGTSIYYSNRVAIGRQLLQLAELGVDLGPVCPRLEELFSADVPGALALSTALCIHKKRTGEEPEILPHPDLDELARGHCPNPVINYRRTLGEGEEGESCEYIRWARCAACLSQHVRLLYFDDDYGWGYNNRSWEFRCLKCGKYTIYCCS